MRLDSPLGAPDDIAEHWRVSRSRAAALRLMTRLDAEELPALDEALQETYGGPLGSRSSRPPGFRPSPRECCLRRRLRGWPGSAGWSPLGVIIPGSRYRGWRVLRA